MSEQTKIQWCDSTINFWSGCAKVSDGCKNCYAEKMDNRHLIEPVSHWGKGAPRLKSVGAVKMALALNNKPFVCARCGGDKMLAVSDGRIECKACEYEEHEVHRRRVFSLSRGDWLDEEVPIEWLAEMLDTIRRCESLEWLLVTKRPELFHERMMAVRKLWACDGSYNETDQAKTYHWIVEWMEADRPPQGVMVLTSVENQKAADERIPALLKIPAARRGLSCEPLLGPVKLHLNGTVPKGISPHYQHTGNLLHWIIVGGESGPAARPCNLDWISGIKGQCEDYGIPCFVKQLGASPFLQTDYQKSNGVSHSKNGLDIRDKMGGDITEWPNDLQVREFYK